jgi:ribulose-phosphate 3-epimerase
MPAQISPAITAENADQYKQAIERVHQFANRLHIDISDGEFAPTFLVKANEIWWPQNCHADIHAMVARPSEHVDLLVQLKPDLIIFHAEVQEDIVPVLQKVTSAGIKTGIALLKTTVPSTVSHLIQQVEHVMIFSGDLGKHGGTASMMQIEKIRLIKQIKQEVEIGWDGGVVVDNAFTLTQAGVDVLNVGGALASSADPAATYASLVQEAGKQGII